MAALASQPYARSLLLLCSASSGEGSSGSSEPSSSSPSTAALEGDSSSSSSGPWSALDLERMVAEEHAADDEALGGTWRMYFEDDPAGLFEYTDRAYEEYGETLQKVLELSESERKVGRGKGRGHQCHAPCVHGVCRTGGLVGDEKDAPKAPWWIRSALLAADGNAGPAWLGAVRCVPCSCGFVSTLNAALCQYSKCIHNR